MTAKNERDDLLPYELPKEADERTGEAIARGKSLDELERQHKQAAKDVVLVGCEDAVQLDSEGNAYRSFRVDEQFPATTPDDGPHSPNIFRWKGNRYEVQPRAWWVLNAMWMREARPESEVAIAAWGSDDVSSSALKSAIAKVNRVLEVAEFTSYLHQKAGYVVWDDPV